MTKEQLWKIYSSRNPQFASDGSVKMSAAGLRKLFDQTWEIARIEGFENGCAWQAMNGNKNTKPKEDGLDFFKDIFRV